MSLAAVLSELARNPGSILAWEVDEPATPTLSVFQIDGGTKQLAHVTVGRDERAAIAAELDKLGHMQASYATVTGHVWCTRDGAFSVWGAKGRVFHSDGKTLDFARRSLALDPAMKVVAFVAPDFVSRGVSIRASDGDHLVAGHSELRASMDWSYGALDALADSGWTIYLGRELANFLGLELVDETGGP